MKTIFFTVAGFHAVRILRLMTDKDRKNFNLHQECQDLGRLNRLVVREAQDVQHAPPLQYQVQQNQRVPPLQYQVRQNQHAAPLQYRHPTIFICLQGVIVAVISHIPLMIKKHVHRQRNPLVQAGVGVFFDLDGLLKFLHPIKFFQIVNLKRPNYSQTKEITPSSEELLENLRGSFLRNPDILLCQMKPAST